ncbi:unnamed protein product, partial [Durusdinium trenchii]
PSSRSSAPLPCSRGCSVASERASCCPPSPAGGGVMTSVASPNAQSDPPTLLKAMSMSANPQSEEVPEASQRLSLDDPRMIVAMQVLGIDMEDLVAPKPPPAPPMSHDRSPRK